MFCYWIKSWLAFKCSLFLLLSTHRLDNPLSWESLGSLPFQQIIELCILAAVLQGLYLRRKFCDVGYESEPKLTLRSHLCVKDSATFVAATKLGHAYPRRSHWMIRINNEITNPNRRKKGLIFCVYLFLQKLLLFHLILFYVFYCRSVGNMKIFSRM